MPAPSTTAPTVAVQPTRTGSGSSAAMTRTLGTGDSRDTVEIETPSRSSDVIGLVRPTSTTAAGWASESNVMRSPSWFARLRRRSSAARCKSAGAFTSTGTGAGRRAVQDESINPTRPVTTAALLNSVVDVIARPPPTRSSRTDSDPGAAWSGTPGRRSQRHAPRPGSAWPIVRAQFRQPRGVEASLLTLPASPRKRIDGQRLFGEGC